MQSAHHHRCIRISRDGRAVWLGRIRCGPADIAPIGLTRRARNIKARHHGLWKAFEKSNRTMTAAGGEICNPAAVKIQPFKERIIIEALSIGYRLRIVIMILIIRVDRFVMLLLSGAVDGHRDLGLVSLARQRGRVSWHVPMPIKWLRRRQYRQKETIGGQVR